MRSLLGRARAALIKLGVIGVVLIAVLLSIWLALRVTPQQTVTAAGQDINVGATSSLPGFSGPGELDLWGQKIATKPQFTGLIRPRFELSKLSFDPKDPKKNQKVTDFLVPEKRQQATQDLGNGLKSGWLRYFVCQTLIAAGIALLIGLALAALLTGSRSRPRLLRLALGFALVTAVFNVAGIGLTAYSTPKVLSQVHSLDDLVGRSTITLIPGPIGPARPDVDVVVIGDSTAAAIGNDPVADPSPEDKGCGRSRDAYAADLARVNGWNVLNLACSGASVTNGLLGSQTVKVKDAEGKKHELVVPPQLGVAKQAKSAKVLVVSIGANDLQWSVMVGLCAKAPTCDDKISAAYFDSGLTEFTKNYFDLLRQLAQDLPSHPRVVINKYYRPFGDDLKCLEPEGLTAVKAKVLLARLSSLNNVLEQGAKTFGFATADPDFDRHQLCSAVPYVHGPHEDGALHPNAAGELAMALSIQQAIMSQLLAPAPPQALANAGGPDHQ